MPHLPWAESDDDEFYHPSHGWYLLSRSIIHDGWLSWRHAIPDCVQARQEMPLDVSASIAFLAQALHDVHMTIPGYGDLDDTPFRVSRWWDPEADDEWQTGCCILFRYNPPCPLLEDRPAAVFQSAWEAKYSWESKYKQDPPARLIAVSNRHLEATLVRTPLVLNPWIGTGSPTPANRQSSSSRRKSRTLPPGRLDQPNGAQQLEQH